MTVQKLETTDAFVVVDFPDAPASGTVRRAKKILETSATDMARSATYTFAAFEHQRSGASAGINTLDGDDVEAAINAFATELSPAADAGQLRLYPGKGVAAEAIANLNPGNGFPLAGSDEALVAGVIAATAWALGGSLDGKRIAIEQSEASSAPPGLASRLEALGAAVVEIPGVDSKPWLVWSADVDAILAGSKLGILNHQGAEMITASAIVPWGPLPATTKAFAVLHRSGKTRLLPDFVSTAGPLLGGVLPGEPSAVISEVVSSVEAVLDEITSHDEGVFLGACKRAETFMATWQPKLPFGRPLAG